MEKVFDIKKHNTGVYTLHAGINETTFFSASGDGVVGLWDLKTKDVLPLSIKAEGAVFSLLFQPDLERLIIGRLSGGIHIVDLSTKEEIKAIDHHKKGVFQIQEINGNKILTLGGDGYMSIWDRKSLELIRNIPLSGQKLRAITPIDDSVLAVGGSDGQIHLLENEFWNTVQKVNATNTGITSLAKHPNKPVLIVGDNHGYLHFYKCDQQILEFMFKLPAHQGAIYSIVFDQNKEYFATGSRDKNIKIWNANDLSIVDKAENRIVSHRHSVNSLLWHSLDNTLISAGDDARVIGWKLN